VNVAQVKNSTAYHLRVKGQEVEITSQSSATNDNIIADIKTAVDLLSQAGLSTTVLGSSSSHTLQLQWDANIFGYVSLTDSSGIDFGPLGRNLLGLAATTADTSSPDIATQLDSILLERDDWYFLVNPYAGLGLSEAMAAWAEANKRLFI